MTGGAVTGAAKLRIVHDSVPGRLRVRVSGLRGDPDLKARIEGGLTRHSGIHRTRASTETGTVLIGFAPSEKAEAVLRALERCLEGGDHRFAPDEIEPPARSVGAAAVAPEPSAGATEPSPLHTWFTWPHGTVLTHFGVDPHAGLDNEAAQRIAEVSGPNTLAAAKTRGDAEILVDQFASLPTAMLGASALLSLVTRAVTDALATLTVVALNSLIGFTTEREAERTISSLSRTGAQHANVLRAGRHRRIEAAGVVPGDIVVVSPGAVVPADGRVIEANALQVDESLLTGESLPAQKTVDAIDDPKTPIGDRRNMIFRGTSVAGGNGKAVIVGTGADTEIGRIQALTGASRPPETPMQKQLDGLGRLFVWGCLGICSAMFGIGLLRGFGRLEMLKSASSLAVAALPEGLPTVATVTLALGIRQMRRERAIVRRLDAVETLGSVNVICFDKTGTLTENRMTAAHLVAGGTEIAITQDGMATADTPVRLDAAPTLAELLDVGILCSEATAERDRDGIWRTSGSPTERALLDLALSTGVEPQAVRRRLPLIDLQVRAEGRNHMTSRHALDGREEYVAIKGSPVEVLALSTDYCDLDGSVRPLDDARRSAILDENSRLAGRGMRVLGFAAGRRPAGAAEPRVRWLGIAGLADPVRPDTTDLIGQFHRAGVRTVMITGDQTSTAYAIASELDLSNGQPVEILEGSRADGDDGGLLTALAARAHVFARVSPASKLRIVQALQANGDVVAMTGDGINDSPSLRAAEIGIAMGSGTDAAHEVADLVLQDDRLATLATALRDGRGTYYNIRNAIHYLLSTNLSEIAVMMAATGFRLGPPLTPLQLLTINIVTDVFPALALAVEPAPDSVMGTPPRRRDQPMFDRDDFARMAREASVITAGALGGYLYGRRRYGAGPGTSGLVFAILSISQLLHAIPSRARDAEGGPPFGGPLNRRFAAASFGPMALLGAAWALPVTRRMLGLAGTGPVGLMVAAGLSFASFVTNELIRSASASADRLARARSTGPEDPSP